MPDKLMKFTIFCDGKNCPKKDTIKIFKDVSAHPWARYPSGIYCHECYKTQFPFKGFAPKEITQLKLF